MPEQTSRIVGIVSNCWKWQLENGQLLESLIEQAAKAGYHAVELRQGCLGEYETSLVEACHSTMAREQFAELARRHPTIRFNLAVSLPLFAGGSLADEARVQSALAAANSLAHDGVPHLRIVDTETRSRQLSDAAINSAVRSLVSLTDSLSTAGGSLSIEHAYQEWSVFWSTILKARNALADAASRLRICLDPCNLLLTEPADSVESIVNSLSDVDISMVHLKQRRDGQIQPDVGVGDLDWDRLVAILDQNGYPGPWLFEVAPHADVWSSLSQAIFL